MSNPWDDFCLNSSVCGVASDSASCPGATQFVAKICLLASRLAGLWGEEVTRVSDVLLYFAILAVGVPALFGVGAVGFARAYAASPSIKRVPRLEELQRHNRLPDPRGERSLASGRAFSTASVGLPFFRT